MPIVAGHFGGCTDHLREGINARLIASTQRAIDRVTELAANAGERARLGAGALRHAVALNAELPRRTVALLANGGHAS